MVKLLFVGEFDGARAIEELRGCVGALVLEFGPGHMVGYPAGAARSAGPRAHAGFQHACREEGQIVMVRWLRVASRRSGDRVC